MSIELLKRTTVVSAVAAGTNSSAVDTQAVLDPLADLKDLDANKVTVRVALGTREVVETNRAGRLVNVGLDVYCLRPLNSNAALAETQVGTSLDIAAAVEEILSEEEDFIEFDDAARESMDLEAFRQHLFQSSIRPIFQFYEENT